MEHRHRKSRRPTVLGPPLGPSADFSPALSLGLPTSCVGCGCWETALCSQCRELPEVAPFAVEYVDTAGDLDIWTLAFYIGSVRVVVLGWKDGAREDPPEAMARSGRHLGRRWIQAYPPTEVWIGFTGDTRMLVVVPAPPGIVRRLRGRLVAAHLTDAVTRGICAQWTGRESAVFVLSTDLLYRRGGGVHQAGRSTRQRRGNRAQALRLLAAVIGLPTLLVDDVMTTGTTLGACARALRVGGGRVLGVLVPSATPPPAHARAAAPVGPGVVAAGRRIPGCTDPGAFTLSACGDQKASLGRGAYEREA